MRILFLLTLLLLFMVACNDTPEQHELPFPTWEITINNFGSPYGDICATQNGGCAVVRESEGQTTVLVFDAYGDQIRQVNLAKYTSEEGYAICETHSGDLLVTGRMGSDTYVAFIPSTNDTILEMHYDLAGALEIGKAITEAADGSVYVCGLFNHQFGLLKLSQDLETEWTRFAGDTLNSDAQALTMLPDGNIAVVGRNLSNGFIAIFDPAGNQLRAQSLDQVSMLVDIDVTTDYEIVVAGYDDDLAGVYTLDENFNPNIIGGLQSTNSVAINGMELGANGLPTLLCTVLSDNYSYAWLSQWSMSGGMLWYRDYMTYNGNAVALATGVDGGYFVYGFSSSGNHFYLYKVNEHGNY